VFILLQLDLATSHPEVDDSSHFLPFLGVEVEKFRVSQCEVPFLVFRMNVPQSFRLGLLLSCKATLPSIPGTADGFQAHAPPYDSATLVAAC
jgi:hypothetical protein